MSPVVSFESRKHACQAASLDNAKVQRKPCEITLKRTFPAPEVKLVGVVINATVFICQVVSQPAVNHFSNKIAVSCVIVHTCDKSNDDIFVPFEAVVNVGIVFWVGAS